MHSDEAVKEKAQDRFQRYAFAKRIAKVILNRPTTSSITIGIYGQWGEGKTSVLEFICEELGEQVILMRFNPWRYLDERQILEQFFTQLADLLKVTLLSWQDKANQAVRKYGGLFSSVPLVSIKKETIDSVSNFFKQTNQEKQRKLLTRALLNLGKKIVVLIDDVDRLESGQVQAVFRLVQSIADFPNITYLLSLDPQRVAEALSPVFGDGQEYLEKIIQVPLTLPKAQPDALLQYTYELLNQAVDQPDLTTNDEEIQYFKRNFELYLAKFVRVPRDAVRINNGLTFVLPMLQGEVHMGDLMLLESLKILHPPLYHNIREFRSVYLSTYTSVFKIGNANEDEQKKTEAKAAINAHLSIFSKSDQKLLRSLLEELFPQLSTLYHNLVYAGDERYKEWHQQKRVCSGQYFERYFTYDIIEGEISDKVFSNLLATLNAGSMEIITDHFEKALLEVGANDFVLKLRFFEDTLSSHEAAQLGRVICRLGGKFFIKDGLIFNTATHAVYLIKRYIHQQERVRRGQYACELLETVSPVDLTLTIYADLWEVGRREGNEDEFTLSLHQLKQVEQSILNRLLNKVSPTDLFRSFDENEFHLFLQGIVNHQINIDELRNRVNRFIEDDRTACLILIKLITPTILTTRVDRKEQSREHIKSEFNEKDYDLLITLANASNLYNQTLSTYGRQEYIRDESDWPYPELTDIDLIGLFQQFYENSIISST